MTKTAQKPRERGGKIALVDCPRVCTVSAFPALCERLNLFTRPPHRATVGRWVKSGTLPTVQQNGVTYILVHQYLKQLAVAF